METGAGSGWFDNSIRALLASNAVTLVIALVEDWSLAPLLLVYWSQSVIIGGFHVRRLLNLREYTTEGLKMNGRPVEAGPKAQRQIAGFFALHYGFFHFVYLIFVVSGIASDDGESTIAWLGLAGAMLVFAVNHFFSYIQNRDFDRQGKPNIGTMLFLPYARVVPMHLLIVMGATLGGDSRAYLAFFIVLKILADAVMHVVEHRALRKNAVLGSEL